jgi:hypothetical protein
MAAAPAWPQTRATLTEREWNPIMALVVSWRLSFLCFALLGALLPHAAAAQSLAPSDATLDELQTYFTTRGYQVEAPLTWDWLAPAVTTFRVRDPRGPRQLLVEVFADEASARIARQHPSQVPGSSQRIWVRNIGLLELNQVGLQPTSDMDPRSAPVTISNPSPPLLDAELLAVMVDVASRSQ